LVNGTLRGTVVLTGDRLLSDNLALRFPGLRADLTLRGDLARGGYALAGPVEARGVALENLGTVDAGGKIRFMIGNGGPWRRGARRWRASPRPPPGASPASRPAPACPGGPPQPSPAARRASPPRR